jgi:FtsP/CotA-like multicopper oxidase with cupredoxin domain
VLAFALLASTSHAEVPSLDPNAAPELDQPLRCSPLKPFPPELNGICEITPLPAADCHPISPGAQCHKVKVNLTANARDVDIGGYKVKTAEHYNNSYLTPVIEAMPGDTVAARLINELDADGTMDGSTGVNPTNLHYFHGGIVTPRNAWPMDARDGTGDNIYVWLKNGSKHDFDVPIPGKDRLDARVLESEKENGVISHPEGLNWYHSHLHGISSDQVMGGMSGLLSVGEDNANVKAKCPDTMPTDQCNKDTDELKKRTTVQYALLRDISLKEISASPLEQSSTEKTATLAPELRDFGEKDFGEKECKVWRTKNDTSEPGNRDHKARLGFCQRDQNSAWLFTLNGQRFPKITIKEQQNLLLRLGNLSPNVAYRLELYDQVTGNPIKLNIIGLDGVVPARPVAPEHAKIPVDAVVRYELLLMPASRAEIYIRNDDANPSERHYVLRTKGLDAGFDQWPEIQIARIDLMPSQQARSIPLALNVPIAQGAPKHVEELAPFIPKHSGGCVDDLDPAKGELRVVEFRSAYTQETGKDEVFGIKTTILHPPTLKKHKLSEFQEDKDKTVDATFEAYKLKDKDGAIDWDGISGLKHVCIHLDHKGSHKQLWVLTNTTSFLHNFHIHQIKFRLATIKDFSDHYLDQPDESHTCTAENNCSCDPMNGCTKPDYKLFEDTPDADKNIEWHDTIPVPPGKQVFLVMSFDAQEQIGRFVYHCHILKHEDVGLMAPIEVWGNP